MVEKPGNKLKFAQYRGLALRQVFPYILIISAIVGLVSSFVLTLDHISLLKNPNQSFICDVNPVLSCGSVMQSKAAVILGFPNSIMGIASFAAMAILGLALLAGAKLKSWFWKLYSLSVIAGLGFMFYLMYESLFVIKAICIYCLCVWIVLIASSWYTFLYMLSEKHLLLANASTSRWLRKHHGDVLALLYVILIIFILREFWYYYGPKLGF